MADLHKTLARQLAKLDLSKDTVPEGKMWCDFLDRVNAHYLEMEQDRYLLERSMEISSREMTELNNRLVDAARKEGMAEVSTSILHNVGNILNSVNVSLGLIQENLSEDSYEKLFRVNEIIKRHFNHLIEYFNSDPKGKLIPEYLIVLLNTLEKQHALVNKEVSDLAEQISHIKDITAMQKNLSGVSGMVEKVFVPEVIEAALKMSQTSDDRKIKMTKQIDTNVFITTDKSKLLQILVNLLKNAKDAVLANREQSAKTVTVHLSADTSGKTIHISCSDSGTGISEENLIKIFSFGFTTKTHGHGFGLHSSAIAAHELGGKLEVLSKGIGHGATFILTLPIMAPERRGENESAKLYADYSH